ncbi:FimV/HubP family polar landmark protein [Microbulbifer sp. Q7]|uniref:FimV/HubP family polar landmark protein n=1 Tax=Microbulbifer sp. Q7 TaxID=1785091 RepID=UPI00082E0FFF|nr:FimV/HubP family polar landmark protein [Microbulbifer sp. Q7]
MRVQKLALAVGLVSALGGNGALALGLGEIKLNSTLNQPLNAEINLLQTRGLGESEIKVRLASTEDFERAGVDRAYLLDDLRFDVDYSSGKPVVRISSRNPIREPFLNFLVETRWPSGRLLREYTLLMDLPAFSTNTASQPVRAAERERQQVRRDAPVQQPLQPTVQRAPEPVQAPVQAPESPAVEVAEELPEPMPEQAPEETPVSEPQETVYEAPAEEPVELQRETVTDSGSRVYGPVEANKTLWEIARDSRETRDVSVQQTMLAIQRLNPEAFINNNINLLKKGAVLRLPTADEVRNLSLTEAVSQVATQNDAWRERIGAAETDVTGAPLDGRATVEETVASDTLEGRVSLAAPGDNESVLSGSGSGTGDSELLEGELAVTEEELDKSRLENAELQDRLGELNEQIDTMERLVEVSNDELQAVQAAAEQTADATETAVDESVFADEAALDEELGEEPVTLSGEETQSGVSAEESVEAEPVAEVAPVAVTEAEPEVEEDASRNRVVVQTRPEPTLVERVMDNIVPIGIGAGALLVGLFGFMSWRRRKEEEEAIRQVEAEMAAERALADAPELAGEEDNLSAVEEMEANETFDLDQLGEVETDDPVAEAEIHLSLDQYQEAEAKLLAGLKAAPENIDARLMLLEVYANQQNGEQFDAHYRQLLSYSDGPAADRAARLRETIAGIGAFSAPENDFSSESLEAAQLDDMGADFDATASFDDLDEFSGSNNSATTSESASDDDFGLLDDLSLDLDDDRSAEEAVGSEDEFSLDLDLGDDLGESLDSDLSLEDTSAEPAAAGAEEEISFDLDLAGGAEEPALDSAGSGSEDNFDLDDLVADGELDLDSLDSLDLDSDFSIDSASEPVEEAGAAALGQSASIDVSAQSATAQAVEEGGLEFDLDLTPMEDEGELSLADSGNDAQSEESLDDLESFGDDLGSLDLDSIDLGDLDLDGDDLSSGAASQAGSSSAEFGLESELDSDLDIAVAEESVAQPAQSGTQPAADEAELSDLSFNLESDLDSELNLLEGSDEVSTKLELAQAYLDMGDKEGAREILGEVVEEAAGEHQQRAKDMLARMS